MNTYKAVTDKVICLIPPAPKEEQIIDGIHLPPNVTRESLDRNPIGALLVHDAGPDCKTVRKGDTVVYNRNHQRSPFEFDGDKLIVIPEGQLIAVMRNEPAPVAPEPASDEIGKPVPKPKELTIEQIRAEIKAETALIEGEPVAAPASD